MENAYQIQWMHIKKVRFKKTFGVEETRIWSSNLHDAKIYWWLLHNSRFTHKYY